MINYQSQETRDANNAIAERHLARKLVGSGVDRALPGQDKASVAKTLLAKRNAG